MPSAWQALNVVSPVPCPQSPVLSPRTSDFRPRTSDYPPFLFHRFFNARLTTASPSRKESGSTLDK